MTFPFYVHDETQAGFRYDGSTWTQFGAPMVRPTSVSFSSAAAALVSDPLRVYVTKGDVEVLWASTNGGTTWTQQSMPTLDNSLTTDTHTLWARSPGEVYLLNNRPDGDVAAGNVSGIWRTTNGGGSWTRIVPFTVDLVFETGGGLMAFGTTKMFYAQCTARTPLAAQFYYTWTFNRANPDGTGTEVWASHVFSDADHKHPYSILLRAVNDEFVLAAALVRNSDVGTSEQQGLMWKIDATGITDVRPSAILRPWDLLPLTATRWLAVGTTQVSNDVLVYRTDNAGSTWSLMATIPTLQGFAENGLSDQYYLLSAPRPSVPDEVVMLGNAAADVQQIVWTSTDAGATWTSMVNTADPPAGAFWNVGYPGGLASVCAPTVRVAIPARLATIVG